MKILFASASVGAGHAKAAAALAAAVRGLAPAAQTRCVDVLDFLPPAAVKAGLGLYLRSLAVFPQAYEFLYDLGNRSRVVRPESALWSRWLAERLRRDAAQASFYPDAVICTHAAAAAACQCWRMAGADFYHAGVVTDFTVHRLWVRAQADDYFTADLRCSQGIAEKRVHGFGIPVHADFFSARRGAAAPKNVLLVGGGEGLLPMRALLRALDGVSLPLKIMAVAGKNESLRRRLCLQAESGRHPIEVLGFTDQMPRLMRQADLLISKGGGMSLSEALCSDLPVFVYCPLPGAERANVDFLQRLGAVKEIADIARLPREVDQIFRTGANEWRRMRTCARQAAKPEAGTQIIKYILNKICN